MTTGWNALLIITLLISSLLQVVRGFEIPCNVSHSTIETVQSCPTNEQTYKEAAERKNCSRIQSKCKTFVYHCVRNREKSALIEVCAPWLFIVGHVCGTYHEGYQSIRRTEELCDASNKCPYRYNSTNQFKYQSCYQLASSSIGPEMITTRHRYNTAETILPKDPKKPNKDGKEEKQECSELASFAAAFGAALGSTLGLSCVWGIYRVLRNTRTNNKTKCNADVSKSRIEGNDHLISNELPTTGDHSKRMSITTTTSYCREELEGLLNTTCDTTNDIRHQSEMSRRTTKEEYNASSLNESSNVSIYDDRSGKIRISLSTTVSREHVNKVFTSMPEPEVPMNINGLTNDTSQYLSTDKLIEELHKRIKEVEAENLKLKEREKIMHEEDKNKLQ